MDYRNQRGKFSVTRCSLQDLPTDELRSVFRDMIILHCESNFATDEITYHACHPDFDVTRSAERSPEYEYTPLSAKRWKRKE